MRVLPGRLVALLTTLAIVLLAALAPVSGQPAPDAQQTAAAPAGLAGALAHFLEDDFDETDAGISEVAVTADPRAATIIEALQDGRLSFSAEQKKVFYKDASGKLIDALTGTPEAAGSASGSSRVLMIARLCCTHS